MGFYDGPKIVTDGLVLALNAADRNSYPGSGTTWYDISGNSNNGTMSNVTYSGLDGGNMVFNGTSSNVSISNPLNQSRNTRSEVNGPNIQD